MSELLVFSQTIEGLLRAFGDKQDDSTARQLREIGIDAANLKPAYPLDVWHKACVIGAKSMCPDAPIEIGLFELGRRFICGYDETLLGRGTLQLARLVGPKRSLQRMTRAFRNANNYTETRLVELGPRRFDLWVSDVVLVEFIRGMTVAGLEVSGAKNPRAETVSNDPEGTTYRVTWDEP